MEEVCMCGHSADDHAVGFLEPCMVEDCDCDFYEEADYPETEDI